MYVCRYACEGMFGIMYFGLPRVCICVYMCMHAHDSVSETQGIAWNLRGTDERWPLWMMCILCPHRGAVPETLACVPPTAETCSTTEDGAEPLLCPSGYECHILSPGDVAKGIPNRGQCVKQRQQAGECGCPSPQPHMEDPLPKKPLDPDPGREYLSFSYCPALVLPSNLPPFPPLPTCDTGL